MRGNPVHWCQRWKKEIRHLNVEVPISLVNELQLSWIWRKERRHLLKLKKKKIKSLKSAMDLNNKTLCLQHVYLSNSLSTFILKHAQRFFFFFWVNYIWITCLQLLRLRTGFPITPIPFRIISRRTFPLYVMKGRSCLVDPVESSLDCEGATWINGQSLGRFTLWWH